MSLRWKLAIVLAVTVAVTVTGVSVAAYLVTRNELQSETDRFLVERASQVTSGPPEPRGGGRGRGNVNPRNPYEQPDATINVLDAGGAVVGSTDPDDDRSTHGGARLPVTDADRALAASGGTSAAVFANANVDGEELRVLTVPMSRGGAVQVARSVNEELDVLAGLRGRLIALGLIGTAVAAAVGYAVARRAVRPIERLTAAAEHVALTKDPAGRAELGDAARRHAGADQAGSSGSVASRHDEVGRLAHSFDEMLDALGESRAQQQRLVQDAGHELRTPLTSLRTNVEVLQQADRLDPDDRRRLLADVTFELEELTDMVNEVVQLAQSPDGVDEPLAEVDLANVARDVAARARRRTGRPIEVQVGDAPSVLSGRPSALERAVANLVSNADKFSPPGAPIEVVVDGGRVAVRDHGPGIPAADRKNVFRRFYRADAARAAPGSGLGLSIVEQVARAHGGSVFVTDAAGGGAVVGFDVPMVPAP